MELDVLDRSVFQCYGPDEDIPDISPSDLETEENFVNYNGVEDNEDVATEVKRMHGLKYTARFDTWEETVAFCGDTPILSKFGNIEKIRNGKKKTRVVLDQKRSGISKAAKRFERAALPKVLDVVFEALDLCDCDSARDICDSILEFFVCDVKDAFFVMPNHPKERKYFVYRFRGKYYVALRSTQGSRVAPLTWSRTAALISRLTQSVTGPNRSRMLATTQS